MPSLAGQWGNGAFFLRRMKPKSLSYRPEKGPGSLVKINRAFLLFLLIHAAGCASHNDIRVLNTNLPESFADYLDACGVEYKTINGVFHISNSADNMQALIRAAQILNLKRNLIINNIRNAQKTMTLTGRCYIRKTIKFTSTGEVAIVTDDASKTRLVYDPSHPDAIKQGPRKGYVEYPNVNLTAEQVDAIYVQAEMEAILAVIHTIDPAMIIPGCDWKDFHTIVGNTDK